MGNIGTESLGDGRPVPGSVACVDAGWTGIVPQNRGISWGCDCTFESPASARTLLMTPRFAVISPQ